MMFEWQAARFRAGAAQYLSNLFPGYNAFVSFVAGNYEICRNTSFELNKLGFLKHGLAKSALLEDNWRESKSLGPADIKLAESRSQFEQLYKDKEGKWHTRGWAFLPKSYRPADAILFTYRTPGGKWTIFGFTQATGLPHYIARSLGKDMYSFVPGHDPIPSRWTCAWDPSPFIGAEPPPGALITAWALDFYSGKVYRVNRTQNGKADSDDGVNMEELAKLDP